MARQWAPRTHFVRQRAKSGVIVQPPNKWLQLTVQLVTPIAYAKGAPSCPAAEPGC